ncbi:MAG: hypothetical protein IPN83_07755 [Holophagales bacterium]|nr:hypothetical protein [Holophagales bacterium]
MANGQKGPWIQRGASIAAVFFAAAAAFAPGLRAADPGWPREIRGDAATIILYEPQVESMKGDLLKARSAFSLTPEGKTEPVFGVLFATARMRTDRDARTATLVSATIDRVRFPEITEGQEKELKALVEAEVGQWELVVSLDSLTALLAAAEREQKTSEQLASEPPKILVEKQLAVLVLIDGEPKLETIDGTSLQRVVNTPFAILFDPRAKAFFLSNGETWYEAPAATGPYSVVAKPPADVARIAEAAKKDQQAEEKEQGITGKPKPARPPKVVVSTEPAELLSFDGEPSYVPVTGLADLLYVSNTESNVLKDLQSQLTFVLLSGRWFSSRSLQGPWTFVGADKLPASFAKVPEGSPIGDVLPFVAGTQLAEDAVLDAEIPQTTAINRAEAKLDVSYDGEPEFEAVEGTSLRHAKNASTQVLSSGANYYACDQGVWYVAGSPNGPWEVSTERPPDVDRIPPASPAYQVKYVYVYDVTPEVVYVGYTPGYYGTYVWGPTIVYGTGYHYRPWYRRTYYGWPGTWGFHARWNPWYGWSFGFGYTAGFYSYGSGWHGHWRGGRPHYGHGGWYGPSGWRPPYWGPGYRPGHVHNNIHINVNNRPGYRPGGRPGSGWRPPRPSNNLYNRPQNRMRNAPDRRVPTRETRVDQRPATRPAPRPGGTGTSGARPSTPTRDVRRQPPVAKGKPNDVFAGRDGNVYRRDKDDWRTREKAGWSRPSSGSSSGTAAPRPAPSRDLDRDYSARQRSSQKTQGSRPSSAAPRPAPRSAPRSAPSASPGRSKGAPGATGARPRG